MGPSLARSADWRESFTQTVQRAGLDLALCWRQTDRAEHGEGLYLKLEQAGEVVGRYKYVRSGFVQTIVDSGTHHSERPIVPNGLRIGADLFAPQIDKRWPSPAMQAVLADPVACDNG